MTLLEKAKEMGLEINKEPAGPWATGCPHEHGFSKEFDDNKFCVGHTCAECYAREYTPPDDCEPAEPPTPDEKAKAPRNLVKDTNGGEWWQDPDKQGWTYHEPPDGYQARYVIVDETDTMRHFDTGAVRDSAAGKGRYDLMPWGAIHALAQHCEWGAVHYGERNVDKGIPQHSFIDSGIRHLSMYVQGDTEDHHLVAALWNIAWALEQELKRPELVDLPERTEASGVAW